jgi:hypothetical protein
MENKIIFSLNIANFTTDSQNLVFQTYCGILSTICIIPNLISLIIIIFFSCQKAKMNIQQRIQLMLCITFIGIEIRFIPIITSNGSYYYFQAGISFSFLILATYYQFIYSFIAYTLFTTPKDLSKIYNLFFIYIFPFIFFVFLAIFVIIQSELKLYFKFIAYPENSKDVLKKEISKGVFHFCRTIFFFLNILYIILLLIKIHQVIALEHNNHKYTNKKFKVYLKKLIWYILGMIIVMNPFLFRYFLERYYNYDTGEVFQNFTFSLYFYGMECLSGIIYWFIYIYNKNLLRRFLILFCNKKEENYFNEFNEEKIIHEDSIQEILTERSSIVDESIFEGLMADKNSKKISSFNIENSKEVTSFYSEDENL